MNISKVGIIGSMQYKTPIGRTTGVSPSQRLEELKSIEQINTNNQYGPGSIDETAIPLAREQRLYGLNPFTKAKVEPFNVEKATLSKKYGTSSISFTDVKGMKDNYFNGLSPIKLGALGEDAIVSGKGKIGALLNIKA